MKTNLETERKYLIRIPDLSALAALPGYSESAIVQTYLPAAPGETHRVRARTKNGVTVYTETVKRRVSAATAVETEGEIDRATYDALAKEPRRDSIPIRKTRYTFDYEGVTFEIDVYPAWKRTCVLETELPDEAARAAFPPFLRVIREVTGDVRYSNSAMAKSFPEEDILPD